MLPHPDERHKYEKSVSAIPEEIVKEFAVRYEKEFNKTITLGEAEMMMNRLISLYRLLRDEKRRQDAADHLPDLE
jgi:hypothetical protein